MNINRVFAVLAAMALTCCSGRVWAEGGEEVLIARETIVGNQWKEKLGLNAEQLRKFLGAERAKEEGMTTLRDYLRECTVTLRAQLSENAPEAEVQDSLLRLGKAQKAIAERLERFDESLAAFLSPTQRARLLVWRSLNGLPGQTARASESNRSAAEDFEPE